MLSQDFAVMPALDVLEGRCVRLLHGRREQVTIEGGDPEAAAARFVAEGARRLHVVDLDGAFSGSPTPGLVERVARAGVPVQVGGGYRDEARIEAALAAGADRVIVGTAAVAPEFLAAAARRFGEHLVVSIDVKDGRVASHGWVQTSVLAPEELAAACADAGVARLLVTNTRRDGTLEGPDLELLRRVRDASALPLIAAGGIASLDDLRALRDLGCEGAIAGSALWTGRFTLAEAAAL